MKTFTTSAAAAIEAGNAIVSGALTISCSPAVSVWGGWGNIIFNGTTFIGVGDRAMAQVTSATLGGSSQSVTLGLSGVDPDTLTMLDAGSLRGASAILYRLIFDGAGQSLLDWQVYTRGRVDLVTVDDTVGGKAAISVALEGAARGLGRKGGRMRTDADQRLISGTDGGFKHVSYAATKTLYWGGLRPTLVGNAIGSSPYGGSPPGGYSGRMYSQNMVNGA